MIQLLVLQNVIRMVFSLIANLRLILFLLLFGSLVFYGYHFVKSGYDAGEAWTAYRALAFTVKGYLVDGYHWTRSQIKAL